MYTDSSYHYDKHFISSFSSLIDPRRTTNGNYTYPMLEILFLTISAILSGRDTYNDIVIFGEIKIDWLRKYFPYEKGISSHDTISKLFQEIDNEAFNDCFTEWISKYSFTNKESVISIDGKCIKGSAKRKKGGVHIVSAFASEQGLSLSQLVTDKKSNEITAIPDLIDLISIKDKVITIDAMGCQTKIAKKIIHKEGDYVLQVKGNQEKTEEELKIQFNPDLVDDSNITEDVGHGRIETRICEIITNFEKNSTLEKWKGIQSLIRVTSCVIDQDSDKETVQTRYYISSLNTSAKEFNRIIRLHWAIENNLHWCLDVIFREDNKQRKKENSAANFSIIYKIALNLMQMTDDRKSKEKKGSFKEKITRSTLDDNYREKLLNAFLCNN
ncbi:ISAs1 family transposase [Halosquirtibacter xylanolyticus]|uniref:ISAs1 family transposase n=1 Tax=Halosquirtibacter xylanolyticus TaxID=3374599 RepID=UPI00374988C9|nr:ISAs1 family transposase [Prolixibacteraceae bacterium]